jgi:intraflagellar transport protein 81
MLSEDLQQLEEDLAEKRSKLGNNMPRILKGAEFQKYAEGLKVKAKQYKKLKGELSSVVAEKGILSRTEDILKTRHGDQTEFLAQLEKSRGISGAASMQDTLEEVSEKTMEVNKAKEISLEEISKTVEQINNIIKEKKGKLAPLIKELRQVRTDFSQLESEYNEKKSLYESTAAGLDTERDKLHAEVTAYQDECKREESRYHYLNAMIESTKLILERARLEDAGKNRVGDANQSYRELYQSRFIYMCRVSVSACVYM